MHLINNEEVKIEALNDYTSQQLTEILKKIGVENKEIRKYKNTHLNKILLMYTFISRLSSKVAKTDVIITLYKSIESGYSQCHHTGNRKKASGGWYVKKCCKNWANYDKFTTQLC